MRRFKIWLSRLVGILMLFVIGGVVTKIFGNTSEIAKFYNEKILFTPYNITGIIMLVLACGGFWCGRKGGHNIFGKVSKVMFFISAISFISGIASWIGLDVPSQTADDRLSSTIKNIRIAGIVILSIVGVIILLLIIFKIIDFVKEKKNKDNATNDYIRQNQQTNTTNITNSSNIGLSKDKDRINNQVNSIKATDTATPLTQQKDKKSDKDLSQKSEINENILHIVKSQEIVIESTQDETIRKIAHKICPLCGGKLKGRQNHDTGKWFMGCENYFTSMECKYTIDYPEFKRIEEQF